jgi:phosphatidate cytidylyltransferase
MINFLKRVLSSLILLPLSLFLIFYGSYLLVFFISIFFLISCYEWQMMSKKKKYNYYGFFFLFFSFYTFYQLSSEHLIVYFIMLICISTDVGGYFFGKIFKGPKLIKISPNKTYSGMVGGYLLSLISLVISMNYLVYPSTPIQLFILTFIISTVSQIGDIIVSYFKRLSKIKDTGKILPGHGGLLDRIDGMIFAFPIVFFIDLTGYIDA